jgi:enoyl-CoA hydratase/carnithine racemase
MSGLTIERQGRLALLRMSKARGNAIDEPFAAALLGAVRDLDADRDVHGVLLASGHPKLFCPGLDLVSLYEYDRPAMERFLALFGEAVAALYALRAPLVAAVAGHAVAGGCVLALTADHRILRRGSQLGLNEVRVGVPLPWSVAVLLKAAVPPASLSRVALLGLNFADEEAVAVGLAHEVAEVEGFEAACLARLAEFSERNPAAVAATKAFLREGPLAEMRAQEAARRGVFLDVWFSPEGRERIGRAVEALARKA